ETAIQFHLNNPSLIVRWLKVFREQGIEGLKPRSKGRPSMSKKPNKQKKKEEKKLTREKELERDKELLKLEVAYLKKLRAFRENPNAFHEKHKQKWHLNSKKKDSDKKMLSTLWAFPNQPNTLMIVTSAKRIRI